MGERLSFVERLSTLHSVRGSTVYYVETQYPPISEVPPLVQVGRSSLFLGDLQPLEEEIQDLLLLEEERNSVD